MKRFAFALILCCTCIVHAAWDLGASVGLPAGLGVNMGYTQGSRLLWRSEVSVGSIGYYSALDLRQLMQFYVWKSSWIEWGVDATMSRIWNEMNAYGGGPQIGLGYGRWGLHGGIQNLQIAVPIHDEVYWQQDQCWWVSISVQIWRSSAAHKH